MIETVLRPPFFGVRAALTVLLVALCALLIARTKTQRAILLGLWTGYLLFGLVITNHVSSHDYYSLPLVPIVALSLALVATRLIDRLRDPLRRRSFQAIVAVPILLVGGFILNQKANDLRLPQPDAALQSQVKVYEQIGALVHHTTRALVLDPGGLWYHGWVVGRYWPDQDALRWERRNDGLRPMSADERFVTKDERYWPAVGTMRPQPSVFIVLQPIELVHQPDLCVLLSDHPTIAETPDYVIFDLTRKATPSTSYDAAPRANIRYLHRLPSSWGRLRRGMTTMHVLRVLGEPSRVESYPNLRKPVQDWFYGSNGSNRQYALAFVAGRLVAEAEA
jgi:hypothetical protein